VRLDHLLSRERDPPASRGLPPSPVRPEHGGAGARAATLPGRTRPGRRPRRRTTAGDGGRNAVAGRVPVGDRKRSPGGGSARRVAPGRTQTLDGLDGLDGLPSTLQRLPSCEGRPLRAPVGCEAGRDRTFTIEEEARELQYCRLCAGQANTGRRWMPWRWSADEGRRRRRKVLGSCQQAPIQEFPNGVTPPWSHAETAREGGGHRGN
jgi:hypothetical protein